jgi:hypothetical protein
LPETPVAGGLSGTKLWVTCDAHGDLCGGLVVVGAWQMASTAAARCGTESNSASSRCVRGRHIDRIQGCTRTNNHKALPAVPWLWLTITTVLLGHASDGGASWIHCCATRHRSCRARCSVFCSIVIGLFVWSGNGNDACHLPWGKVPCGYKKLSLLFYFISFILYSFLSLRLVLD